MQLDYNTVWLLGTGFIFLFVFNFMPTAVAYVSDHPDRHLLAAINVIALFSFALWFALMAWAATGNSEHPLIKRFVGTPKHRGRLMAGVLSLVLVGVGMSAYSLNLV
ncbi:superinfection immunity protein [Sandarakinorhabdus sp.]|uniref:superinfection immunity protein n=1 Tax=Sandarakinorhabdus sp. TaxID=1916663 RepID=UPI00286DFADA|nr:superinfection immunity protein [Sandarakinorhabdus sp.]